MAARKTIMGEVLPDPKVDGGFGLAARERVYRHARRLLQSSVATGSALAVACSCVAVDPAVPPARCATPTPAPKVEGFFTGSTNGDIRIGISISQEKVIAASVISFSAPSSVTGGTVQALADGEFSIVSAGGVVSFRLTATIPGCDAGTDTYELLVSVTPSLADAGPDAGPNEPTVSVQLASP
jgi:hypothetical protein